jgi:hypothetical protein
MQVRIWRLGILALAVVAGAPLVGQAPAQPQAAIREAIRTIRSVPDAGTQYDYVMSAAVRLGLFWVSREDVGSGSIKVGRDGETTEFIRLVIGSDPDKAPMNLNRWGAATEVLDAASGQSVFFGLLKLCESDSPPQARRPASADDRRLRVLIGANRGGTALSTSRLIALPRELTVKDASTAQATALNHLEVDGETPQFSGPSARCDRCLGFLFSVRELIQQAIAGSRAPIERCYRYNGKVLTAKLARLEDAGDRKLAYGGQLRQYRRLRRAQFDVTDQTGGERHHFELLLGTEGPLAGVPVQIEYRPNWWLKLVLTLGPESPAWQRAERQRPGA